MHWVTEASLQADLAPPLDTHMPLFGLFLFSYDIKIYLNTEFNTHLVIQISASIFPLFILFLVGL